MVNTVKNLLSVSRDAKNWQEQIKKTQVFILHVTVPPISFHCIMRLWLQNQYLEIGLKIRLSIFGRCVQYVKFVPDNPV